MQVRRKIAVLLTLCVVSGLAGACAGNDEDTKASSDKGKVDENSGPSTPLSATEKEFSISLDKATIPAGAIKLTVSNAGTVMHELVAFRTDLPVDGLPLENGSVNEKGAGITHIDPEAEDIAAGKSKTVTLHLNPGRYVLLCNVPGHYKGGMATELTVS